MDHRPIGVFDSGLGGLTAVRELRRLLPGEDIIYFGDTGRVPYGGRSPEAIVHYARQDVAFLRTFDLKAIVVACGTVSSVALPKLLELTDVPILGVIDPAVRAAVRATKNGRIGVVGTSATIRSGTYREGLLAANAHLEIISKPCPLLVPLVEEYLTPLLRQDIDTLILGCTHYPLLTGIFSKLCGPNVTLINPGHEAIASLKTLLEKGDALRGGDAPADEQYYVSDSEQQFLQYAEMFLRGQVQGRVQRIDIESY